MLHAIQSEWIFLQRVTWDTGDAFEGVEQIIFLSFLKTKTLSPIVRTLSTMPNDMDGIGVLNPVASAK